MSASGSPTLAPTLIASDPRRSAWVAANAGSGKTYTLASRVTRLLLTGARPERILCLTYTKAAAAEMSTRLFAQLGEWAMLPDDALRARIADLSEPAGDAAALAVARRLFAAALETPGGLKIQTIHSFCQHVLMRFPLEAGVPAGFTVLDERSARDLMAEARARVLERTGTGDMSCAAALTYLVSHLGDVTLDKLLDAALGADRGKIAAFFEKTGEDWKDALLVAHGAGPGDCEARIHAELAEILTRDAQTLREAAAWLSGGTKTDAARGDILAALNETTDAAEKYRLLGAALLTLKGEVRAKFATAKLAAARPDLLEHLQNLAATLQKLNMRKRAVHGAELCAAALTVVEAVQNVYAAKKAARAALDYDDLIVRTRALLEGDGAAWVLYKLDEGIDHVLIDEAQDTSAQQWEIVQALTEDFFADTGAGARARTIFAVGDEKQSIFSFQGADPAQFAGRKRRFARRAEAAESPFSAVDLPVSRRSAPEILRFVDAVFAPAAARDGLTSDTNTPIRHEAFRKDAKGRVEYWPVLTPADEPETDPWDLRPLDLARGNSPLARLADRIAGEIARWIRTGETLPGHDAPIAPGDIMILLPRREPFASEIIRKLKDAEVPVAGADRLKLAENIAVTDLISLGRFALAPGDDLSLAEVLRSPLVGLSEEDLYALAHGRNGRLWPELVRAKDRFPAAYAILAEVQQRADFLPPFEFYAAALKDGRGRLLKRLGPETADAVEEFLSLALAYEQTGTPSLQGFLHWFAAGGAEVKRDMDRSRGEVRVMTVHGAKGLEADIVILPDTTTVPDTRNEGGHLLYTDDGILYPLAKDDAPEAAQTAKSARTEEIRKERRRLLYVALTRARERLYVCGFENKRGTMEGSWNRLCRNAMLALTGRTEGEDAGQTDDVLVYGDGSAARTEMAQDAVAPPPVAVPDWARKPAPAEAPRPWLIRPSQAAGTEDPSPGSPLPVDQRVRRGILAHALFARLPDIAPEARESVAKRYLAARGLAEGEAAALIADVLAVLNDPVFSAAFAPGSRAEVTLAADLPELGPNARVHGRIDRLAAGTEQVLIVDFKTGRHPPATPDAVPPLYLAQMALYRMASQKIFPGKDVVCALVWTAGPLLMTLEAAQLDAETNRIRDRLTAESTIPK